MTEIPEHLLKRSRDRRAALEGASGESPAAAEPDGGGDAGGHTGIRAGDRTDSVRTGRTQPGARSPPRRRLPSPTVSSVAAYKRRNRIPFWAMLALALLPLWAFMYARAVTTQAEAAAGPLAVGTDTYSRVRQLPRRLRRGRRRLPVHGR